MWGLADCNNFFVSCERTRNPGLEGMPVVVLSNNDGCVVARSNEAKALGIKMGQPAFQIRDIIRAGQVTALSGDHLLYRSISIRVHEIFRRYSPVSLDYSVDEAFMDMSGIDTVRLQFIGETIVRTCAEEEHIPVTVGFAPTKTLAKIATESGKKSCRRVVVLEDMAVIADILAHTSVSDVWGIGRRIAKKLYSSGVYSAADFTARPLAWIRSTLGIHGERCWRELRGEPCIELEHVERTLQDSISETRTFPTDESDFDVLRSRIAVYASNCARRLRDMHAHCRNVTVFLRTNRFHTENGYQSPQTSIAFRRPVNDTALIVEAAHIALKRIYSCGCAYKRAGVIISGISNADCWTPSLFDESANEPAHTAPHPGLLTAIDGINRSVGQPLVRLASQLTGPGVAACGYSSSFQAPKALPGEKNL